MVLVTFRARVYYRVTPVRVTVVSVTAGGARSNVAPPRELRRIASGVTVTSERVRRFARSSRARELAPGGGRLEWYIRYSPNSLKFDRTRLVASTTGTGT